MIQRTDRRDDVNGVKNTGPIHGRAAAEARPHGSCASFFGAASVQCSVTREALE